VSFDAFLIFYVINSESYSNLAKVVTSTLGTCKIGYVNRKVEAEEKAAYFKEPAFGLFTVDQYYFIKNTQLV